MFSLVANKFQNFVRIQLVKSPEFNRAIQPFLSTQNDTQKASGCSIDMSISLANYNDFLKTMRNFDRNMILSETQLFDSQEPMSDNMITNTPVHRRLGDIIFEGDCPAEGLSSTKWNSQKKKSLPAKQVSITHEYQTNELKVRFGFNRELVELIKKFEEKRYDPDNKVWYIRLEQK